MRFVGLPCRPSAGIKERLPRRAVSQVEPLERLAPLGGYMIDPQVPVPQDPLRLCRSGLLLISTGSGLVISTGSGLVMIYLPDCKT